MLKIYVITNLVNSKEYVGRTSYDLKFRLKSHQSKARNGSIHRLHRAIRKYGENSFKIEQIDFAENIEELKKKEEFWIRTKNSIEEGYNINEKSDGISYHTKETKRKMSKTKKGKPLHPNCLKGRLKYQKEHGVHPNSIEALKESGRKRKGKKESEEVCKNKSLAHEKYEWEITNPRGEKLIVRNLKQFCKNNNLNLACMGQVASNKNGRTQHNGYRCRKII